MSDLEQRLRTGLRGPVAGLDADRLVADVVVGVRRRRRRRATVAVAATVLLVGGAVGTLTAANGGKDHAPPVPLTPSPTATQPPLPEGAGRGVVDATSVASGVTFRLTVNVGCAACSTVWRADATAGGGWQRLHDFGAEAYLRRPDPSYGPITSFAMATDGANGFAWGQRMYATHDGGRTWLLITTGPGRVNNEYGYQLAVTDQAAWSLVRTARGSELWRAPLGSDVWTRDDPPYMAGVSGITAIGRDVALETSDEGLAGPRLQYSRDGTTWGTVNNPCAGDETVQAAVTTAFLACPSGKHPRIYVLTGAKQGALDLGRWTLFATSPARDSAQLIPVGDQATLVVSPGSSPTWLVTPAGTRQVDLGLRRGEEVFRTSVTGTPLLLGTSEFRLLTSTDGGATWHVLD